MKVTNEQAEKDLAFYKGDGGLSVYIEALLAARAQRDKLLAAMKEIATNVPTWDGDRYSIDGYVVQIARAAIAEVEEQQ